MRMADLKAHYLQAINLEMSFSLISVTSCKIVEITGNCGMYSHPITPVMRRRLCQPG